MQDDGRLPARGTARLPVHAVTVADVEHAAIVWCDLGVEHGQADPSLDANANGACCGRTDRPPIEANVERDPFYHAPRVVIRGSGGPRPRRARGEPWILRGTSAERDHRDERDVVGRAFSHRAYELMGKPLSLAGQPSIVFDGRGGQAQCPEERQ